MYMDFRAISDASLVIVFVLLYFAAPYFSGEAGLIAFRFLFATLGVVFGSMYVSRLFKIIEVSTMGEFIPSSADVAASWVFSVLFAGIFLILIFGVKTGFFASVAAPASLTASLLSVLYGLAMVTGRRFFEQSALRNRPASAIDDKAMVNYAPPATRKTPVGGVGAAQSVGATTAGKLMRQKAAGKGGEAEPQGPVAPGNLPYDPNDPQAVWGYNRMSIDYTVDKKGGGEALRETARLASSANDEQAPRFYGKNESAKIGGIDVGGLLYIGNSDFDYSLYDRPEIINVRLAAAKGEEKPRKLNYRVGYSEMDEKQRLRFLKWLASGRGYDEDRGYAFLYLYGFERYILEDESKAENPKLALTNARDIASELRRLIGAYAGDASLCAYANQLMECIYALFEPAKIEERRACFPERYHVATNYALARDCNGKEPKPIDSDWALRWAISRHLAGMSSKEGLSAQEAETARLLYPLLRMTFKTEYLEQRLGSTTAQPGSERFAIPVYPALYFHNAPAAAGSPPFRLNLKDDWKEPLIANEAGEKISRCFREAVNQAKTIYGSDNLQRSCLGKIAGVYAEPLDEAFFNEYSRYLREELEVSDSLTFDRLAAMFGSEISEGGSDGNQDALRFVDAMASSMGWRIVPDPLLHPFRARKDTRIPLIKLKTARPPQNLLSISSAHKAFCLAVARTVCSLCGFSFLSACDSIVKSIERSGAPEDERAYLLRYKDWLAALPSNAEIAKGAARALGEGAAGFLAEAFGAGLAEMDLSADQSARTRQTLRTGLGLDAIALHKAADKFKAVEAGSKQGEGVFIEGNHGDGYSQEDLRLGELFGFCGKDVAVILRMRAQGL